MADNVTLSASVRSSLLSLKSTTSLIERTQGRLSTGLKVSGPIDDPVAYFQSKGLSDRAADFSEKKTGIDQGISTLSTALGGINGVESLVRQLKGLALNTKSATSSQISGLVSQFNDLRTQINNLTEDAQYQGLNLIAGTGSQLSVDFSNVTSSVLTVDSVDVTVGKDGLDILRAATSNGAFQVGYESFTGGAINGSDTISVTYAGTATSLTSGNYTFDYGTQTFTIAVGSAGDFAAKAFTTTSELAVGDQWAVQVFSTGYTATLGGVTTTTGTSQNSNQFAVEFASGTATNVGSGNAIAATITGLTGSGLASGTYTFSYGGYEMTFTVTSAANVGGGTFTTTDVFTWTGALIPLTIQSAGTLSAGKITMVLMSTTPVDVSGQAYYSQAGVLAVGATNALSQNTLGAITGQFVVDSSLVGQINSLVNRLDTALQTLRSKSQTLGSNVALLQTRLDFTNNYVNTLTGGSGKLTLADLNEEGANLLALQTRQQLGIQALSFAGQAEQGILGLFR